MGVDGKILKAPGLYVKVPGRPYEPSEFPVPERVEPCRGKGPGGLKVPYRLFHVGPGRVLRKYGADHDLEAGPAGPPALRAEPRKHAFVVGLKRPGRMVVVARPFHSSIRCRLRGI